MRKKIGGFVVIFVILFNFFGFNFMYVEAGSNATTQPAVCNGPSKMMQNYFNFQKEVKSILLGSQIDERRFYASAGEGWLFTRGSVELPSALDFVASNLVGNVKSNISTAGTAIILLLLTSASVFRANTEGFAILFKDRPIVRDYKSMLDIETELFDVAYFRSKQINLTLKLEGKEVYDNINKVIEKYQGLGLLYKGSELKGTETMADILEELIKMNTAMKHFILFWGSPGERALKKYNGCFGKLSDKDCKDNPVLKFDQKAIDQLKKDYSGLGTFGACNLYLSNFKDTISKSLDNNLDSVKIAFKDVKDALKRLDSALIGDLANSKDNSELSSRCDNISEYEMAQLRAYWGAEWECGKVVDVSTHLPSMQILQVSDYDRNRKSQNDQRNKNEGLIKKSAKNLLQNVDVDSFRGLQGETNLDQLKEKNKEQERLEFWKSLYGPFSEENPLYNANFLPAMADDFVDNYEEIMKDYDQSQRNATSSDLSNKTKGIMGLIQQVSKTMEAAKTLNSELKIIADYQGAK